MKNASYASFRNNEKHRERQLTWGDVRKALQALLNGSSFPHSVRSTTDDYGGFHNRSDPHPYDDCENSNKTEKQTRPNPGRREVPKMLVPGGERAPSALREAIILDRGGRRDPKTAVA